MKSLDDWYKVTNGEFRKMGGGSLLTYNSSISNILQKYYPNHNWKFNGVSQKKSEDYLFHCIQQLFPNIEIQRNVRNIDKFIFSNSQKQAELDIYIPSLKLAFEYQGEQHYEFNDKFGTSSVNSR